GQSATLDAFIVASSQACIEGENLWYASTLELQLVSLEACRVCRSIPTLHVRVNQETPGIVWNALRPAYHRSEVASFPAQRDPRRNKCPVTCWRYSAVEVNCDRRCGAGNPVTRSMHSGIWHIEFEVQRWEHRGARLV
ncbi:unnamed protein product, partial [Ectocarpus sp. 8 AP-2014]